VVEKEDEFVLQAVDEMPRWYGRCALGPLAAKTWASPARTSAGLINSGDRRLYPAWGGGGKLAFHASVGDVEAAVATKTAMRTVQ